MRKGTLAAIAFIISFALVYVGNRFARASGVELPFGLPLGLLALLITPLSLFFLNSLNKYILAYRKARGRDIEEEERFETDTGFIRLTPNDEREK